MTTLCMRVDGAWTELVHGRPVTRADGTTASWESVTQWTTSELEDWGIEQPDEPPPPPEGKIEYSRTLLTDGDRPEWHVTYVDAPAPPVPTAPDNPTLGDWRVGLALWTRKDADGAVVTRLTDVTNAVAALMASDNPELAVVGQVAHQRLEYSNNVLKAEVTQLAAAFQFSEVEVEESFWRASRVTQGDLSGVWPLPAAPV